MGMSRDAASEFRIETTIQVLKWPEITDKLI